MSRLESGDGRDHGEKVESGETVELSLTVHWEEGLEFSIFDIDDEDGDSINAPSLSKGFDRVEPHDRSLALMGMVWPCGDISAACSWLLSISKDIANNLFRSVM